MMKMKFFPAALIGVAVLGATLVTVPAAHAQCVANTGAKGPPSQLWGSLEPTDVKSVPDERDTTEYIGGNQTTDWRHPLFSSVDVEGGYAFTSYAFGFHIWNVEGGNAEDPKLYATRDQGRAEFLENIGYQEQRWLMWDIDAPPGNPDIVAVAGINPFGIAVWDTSDKRAPKALYQDTGRTARGVYVTTINGHDYAFLASSGPEAPQKGLLAYDLTLAKNQYSTGSGCLEDTSTASRCGVFLGRLGGAETFQYVDGFETNDGRHFIVASAGYDPTGYTPGVSLWEVTNPKQPRDVLNGGRLFPDERIEGVAVWERAGRQYLAIQSATKGGARIHEISSCLTSGCTNPRQVWSEIWPISVRPYVKFVTYSEGTGGEGYLYIGTLHSCIEAVQGEWLYNVSDLETTGVAEITPDQTMTVDGKEVGYWSYYYPSRSTGFNRITPRVGKVVGDYLYRAAWTLFDVHRLKSVGPSISVSAAPESQYAGDEVKLTAEAAACTPDPAQWSWSVSGGTINAAKTELGSTSSAVYVTWDSPGTKAVTVSNAACVGASDSTSVAILDPIPNIDSIVAVPTSAPQCTPITLQASATGKPTLSYGWEVDTNPLTTGAGSTFVWDTSGLAVTASTTYSAQVTVQNANGTDQATVPVTITPLQSLPLPGFATLTNETPTAAAVQFHVSEPGATSWNWDFGTGYVGWNADPVTGPNPLHVYTPAEVDAACGGQLPCTFQVKVSVRNCLSDPAGIESAVLQVTITELTPLHAEFKAQAVCQVAPCTPTFTAGEAITFLDSSTGAELYDYDWDGDGSFEDPNHATPVTSHTYPSAGTFSPRLRVRRGSSETDTYIHPAITINPAVPASINISGPSSATVGQPVSFQASASNCTPSPNGWTWSATGVTVTDKDAAIRVSFSSQGTKTITARNSACGTTQGSAFVSVSSGDVPNDDPSRNTLKAAFTFSPEAPGINDEITFDASTSTGSNIAYFWNFGDGTTSVQKVATHSFSERGTYRVTLSLSEKGCLSASCPGDDLTKTVTVTGGVVATFETSAECFNEFGFNQCNANTGQVITFVGTTPGADSHEWDFGDGETATGKQVTHFWREAGNYSVKYTATKDGEDGTMSQSFVVLGDTLGESSNVVLPWIAQADEDRALQQESDLYIHNPGPGPMEVEIVFRKQGLPEADPPSVTRQIPEYGTLYLEDVVKGLFNRANSAGFLVVEPREGDPQPVVTSFNRTYQGELVYGQAVPGLTLGSDIASRATGTDVLHLVGLHDTTERLGYFGLTNPTDDRIDYNLSFYDKLGQLVGSTSEPLSVARFGQKQYRVGEIREVFGVEALDDYRVTIEPTEGSDLPVPYGANLRLGSNDPSFLRAGRTDAKQVFLVGALNTPGLNNSFFHTDLLLSNTGSQPVTVQITFTGVGFLTEPTTPIQRTLPPGDTTRLVDVVSEWDLPNTVGALKVQSNNNLTIYPVVQGESYDATNPAQPYGQFMPALTTDDAAVPGRPVSLVGLRQDDENRSTVWIYNPADEVADYTVRYFDNAGNELGGEEEVRLGAGKFRQINPGSHPLPDGGLPDGFVVRVEVARGQLLVAGQVVNQFNDPAYIVGR